MTESDQLNRTVGPLNDVGYPRKKTLSAAQDERSLLAKRISKLPRSRLFSIINVPLIIRPLKSRKLSDANDFTQVERRLPLQVIGKMQSVIAVV